MAKRVIFTADYEHRFADRLGMVSCKAGPDPVLVKDEVAAGAIAAGKAKPAPRPAPKPKNGE